MEQKSAPRKTLAEQIDDLEAEIEKIKARIEVYEIQLDHAIENNDAGDKKVFGELITERGAYLRGLKDDLRKLESLQQNNECKHYFSLS
jgi:hypothetical protein